MRRSLCICINCQKDQEVASDNQLRGKNRIEAETEKNGQERTKNVQAKINEPVSPLSRFDEIQDIQSESRKSSEAPANTDDPESRKVSSLVEFSENLTRNPMRKAPARFTTKVGQGR